MKKENRKDVPIYSGCLVYFPLALKEVAKISKAGNDQHHKGEPLWWDKPKSADHLDALSRHLTDHAEGQLYDTDGVLHIAKVAWRALANLEIYLEKHK